MATLSGRALPDRGAGDSHGFLLHQGAIFGGLVGPVLAYFATDWHMGFAIPMLIGTTVAAGSVFIVMLLSPETRGGSWFRIFNWRDGLPGGGRSPDWTRPGLVRRRSADQVLASTYQGLRSAASAAGVSSRRTRALRRLQRSMA